MATRNLTTAFKTAAGAKQKYVIAFVELDFTSGFVRVTSAPFAIDWNGHTWTGVGGLGSMEQIEEVLELEATGIRFTLSGIPSSIIATALGEQYQGRTVRAWMAILDAGTIREGVIFVGRMDTMNVMDGETAQIQVTAENRLASWERPRIRRFSDADQQAEFPGDLGLNQIEELASGKQVVLGRS